MFIRFRKIKSDGKRPKAVNARIMCAGYCQHRIYKQCPMKPRCRWRIGSEEQRAPYRLKVILVENKRVNGKVKQETIAVLGSIEATSLPEFWEGLSQGRVDELKAEEWERRSITERTAFWKSANRRLKQLTNRLGPDLKRLRMAAHSRVPYPMEPERKKLELLEAKEDFDRAKRDIKWAERMVGLRETDGLEALAKSAHALFAARGFLRATALEPHRAVTRH